MEDKELIKNLWDYMKMNQNIEKSDCILVLGCSDITIVDRAVDLFNKGYASIIIFSGGLGKITSKIWNEPEANKFAKKAIELGIPKEKIYIENKSTNTGDNFRFTRKLIEKEKLDIHSLIIVCKPYDEKRSYSTFKKIMPEYIGAITSKEITFEEYYNLNENNKKWIDVLVGDIQRMKIFAKKGWQIEMEVPDDIWNSYEELIKRGYDGYLIKEENI